MPNPNMLQDADARQMKQAIWEGVTNDAVAGQFGISSLTISRVRSGAAYRDVPWPDGSFGPLPPMQRQALANGRKRDTRISNAASGIKERFDTSYLEPSEERERLEAVFEETGKRFLSMNEVVDYFREQIREERRVKEMAKHEAYMATLDSPEHKELIARGNDKPIDRGRDDILDPEANERLDWDYILEVADGSVPMVEVANTGDDPALKEAIRVAFKLVGVRQWKQDHMLKLVYSIKAKIERYWEEFGGAPEIETNCFKLS